MPVLRSATGICVLIGLAGCAGRGETDLLHARLREQQQQLADAQSKLDASAKDLKTARRETEALRTQLAQATPAGLLPEQTDLLVRVADLKINPMLTAGLDRDAVAGDDSLAVQFSPVDADGDLVRLPGDITITVLDPKLPAADREVARWTFTAAESHEHWLRGFLGTGYQFTLPWPEPPRHAELVVHVGLKTADGREFTATHVLNITPPVVTAEGVSDPGPRRTDTRRRALPDDDVPRRDPIQESTNWTDTTMPVYR